MNDPSVLPSDAPGAAPGEAAPLQAFGQLLDSVGVGLAVRDIAGGRYVRLNACMLELFGDDVDEQGRFTATARGRWSAVRAADQAALAADTGPRPAVEHRVDAEAGRRDFLVARMVLDTPGAGQVCSLWVERTGEREQAARLQAALVQIEQQQAAHRALRSELSAGRDIAAGLYQADRFEEQLRREVDLSQREHREFALVWVTLDTPPEPGAARERIIEALGTLLRNNTRAMDAACRFDADRFAVLLSGVGLATAHARMEGLRRQCATHIVVLDGRQLRFSVSMGVASFPHTAQQEAELRQAAGEALAEAQRRGGNQVALASVPFDA